MEEQEHNLDKKLEVLKTELEITKLKHELESRKNHLAKRYEAVVNSGLDYWKTQYDFHKHLTTISSASILAIGALLGGFFANPDYPIIVGLSFTALVLSIVLSLRAMDKASTMIMRIPNISNEDDFDKAQEAAWDPFIKHSVQAWASFTAGLGFFVIFALSNIV